MTTDIDKSLVGANAIGDLCAVCGRPPHVCDDPECVPANATLAEKSMFLISENERLRNQALYAYIEVRYALAGLAGVALRIAPNDEHMDSVISRLANLETYLTNNLNSMVIDVAASNSMSNKADAQNNKEPSCKSAS